MIGLFGESAMHTLDSDLFVKFHTEAKIILRQKDGDERCINGWVNSYWQQFPLRQ